MVTRVVLCQHGCTANAGYHPKPTDDLDELARWAADVRAQRELATALLAAPLDTAPTAGDPPMSRSVSPGTGTAWRTG
jgi:hypothetical protein